MIVWILDSSGIYSIENPMRSKWRHGYSEAESETLKEREQGQVAGGMRESKFAWGQEESKKVKTGKALAISSACDKVDFAEALH